MDLDLPVTVAAVNDYDIVVAGLGGLLAGFPDRLTVVDRVLLGEPLDAPVDVALYDTYGRVGVAGEALAELVATPGVGAVAVFSLDLGPDLIAEATAAGASGFISKALSAELIANAVVRVAHGEQVVATAASPRPASGELRWPGKDAGLTERESQVIVLAAEGLSNREIAAALYLSPETIKSHLRQIFPKLGLRNRVQAAAYVHCSDDFRRVSPDRADVHGSP